MSTPTTLVHVLGPLTADAFDLDAVEVDLADRTRAAGVVLHGGEVLHRRDDFVGSVLWSADIVAAAIHAGEVVPAFSVPMPPGGVAALRAMAARDALPTSPAAPGAPRPS